MGQFGFFDTNNRLEALSAKGDPLEAIDALVPWESFRETIEAVVLTPAAAKKSNAGTDRRDRDVPHAHPAVALQSL
jgi:transposase, IS5 family